MYRPHELSCIEISDTWAYPGTLADTSPVECPCMTSDTVDLHVNLSEPYLFDEAYL